MILSVFFSCMTSGFQCMNFFLLSVNNRYLKICQLSNERLTHHSPASTGNFKVKAHNKLYYTKNCNSQNELKVTHACRCMYTHILCIYFCIYFSFLFFSLFLLIVGCWDNGVGLGTCTVVTLKLGVK